MILHFVMIIIVLFIVPMQVLGEETTDKFNSDVNVSGSDEADSASGKFDENLHKHLLQNRRVVNAVRVSSDEIKLDGELNESIWQTAAPATDFVQFEPLSGAQASEKTEVRVLYDQFNLYIGAILHDSHPEGIIADEMRRGADLERNDNFMIVIDSYHDSRNGFFFETNPLGAKVDALIFDEGKHINYDWDGVWWSEAKRTSEGWQVEMKIPFSTLRFNEKTIDTWGVNFGRFIRRKNEYVYWSFLPLDASKWRMSLAGQLVGVEKVRQEKNLEIKPYLALKRLTEKNSSGRKNISLLSDAGLDIKYLITPNLIADLTVNPDFAQVEADELKINVTRFPLFFPEKREFFLESSGYFDFGINGKVQPFFSRRIGISASKEIPILAGGKLSGKVGKNSIGLLSVETKEKDEEPQTNYSVIRLKRDIRERGYIGLIAVNKEPRHGKYNRSFGADLFLPISNYLYVDSFIMKTKTDGISGYDGAGYISVAWDDPKKYLNLSYLDIDDRFNPEVGFVKRTGIKESLAYGEVYLRPLNSLVRKYTLHNSFAYLTSKNNRMIGRSVDVGLDIEFNNGNSAGISYLRNFDLLEAPFEIRPGIVVSEGGYDLDILSLSAATDESKKFSGYFFSSIGDYFDGDRFTNNITLKYRPSKYFKISSGLLREDVDLPAGSFDANLVTATIEYTMSTKTFINALFQWNDDLEEISTNIRFNYEYHPGSNIYLVYNETRGTGGNGLKEQAIIFKITRLWSL